MLTPAYDVPFVPIHMNCIVQPMPSPQRCFEVGGVIARAVRDDASNKRVVIMATGGLSHDPGGPKYFQVDEAFDRWFLDIMCSRDTGRILREVTIERMLAAGEAGTPELLAWIVALGAAGGRPARATFYEPTVVFRCGTGAIVWDMAAVESAEFARA
jgi:protocatechuate 4,5-dioxygenase beta chain